jgi:predicted nucleotidyltransferase
VKNWQEIKLGPKEKQAVEKAAGILKKRFAIDQVILFGSKARGTSDQYSDIDLLLIGPTLLHWREEKAIVEILFQVGQEFDVIFSPLFASSEDWEGGIFRQFPIYQEILKEGASVA